MTLVRMRASSAPRAMACPASLQAPGLDVEPDVEAARLGTAFHAAIRPVVEGGEIDWHDGVAVAALRWGVNEDELRPLLGAGQRMWRQVAGLFGPGAVETEVELRASGSMPGETSWELTGHADILARPSADRLVVGDWKTGRADSDYRHQMMTYAYLAWYRERQLGRDIREIQVFELWVRDEEIVPHLLTRAELIEWHERFLADVVGRPDTYRPGAVCQHCPRSHECPGVQALVRRDVEAIGADLLAGRDVSGDLETLPPDVRRALWDRARLVGSYADRMQDALKAFVLAGGGVPGLTVKDTAKRELDPLKAWPVLEAVLPAEELAGCVDVRISRVEKAVATRAGKGNGAAAVRSLGEQLEAAGAVEWTASKTVRASR